MAVIQISIKNGNLTIDESKKLVKCIREIEQNNPNRHIIVFMNMPDKTVKELEEIMRSIPGLDVKVITKDGVYG